MPKSTNIVEDILTALDGLRELALPAERIRVTPSRYADLVAAIPVASSGFDALRCRRVAGMELVIDATLPAVPGFKIEKIPPYWRDPFPRLGR